MGGGSFILALKTEVRKKIKKRAGDHLLVKMEADEKEYEINEALLACLDDDPPAKKFFNTLPGSHRRYFSKWIEAGKTEDTRMKKILQAVRALSRELGFAEMLREGKKK